MRIEELITHLEKIRKEKGDLLVGYYRYTGGGEEWMPLDDVATEANVPTRFYPTTYGYDYDKERVVLV